LLTSLCNVGESISDVFDAGLGHLCNFEEGIICFCFSAALDDPGFCLLELLFCHGDLLELSHYIVHWCWGRHFGVKYGQVVLLEPLVFMLYVSSFFEVLSKGKLEEVTEGE